MIEGCLKCNNLPCKCADDVEKAAENMARIISKVGVDSGILKKKKLGMTDFGTGLLATVGTISVVCLSIFPL